MENLGLVVISIENYGEWMWPRASAGASDLLPHCANKFLGITCETQKLWQYVKKTCDTCTKYRNVRDRHWLSESLPDSDMPDYVNNVHIHFFPYHISFLCNCGKRWDLPEFVDVDRSSVDSSLDCLLLPFNFGGQRQWAL